MSLKFKNEDEMRKWGLVLDPCDPAKSVSIGQLADRQQAATSADGLRVDASNGRPESSDASVPASEADMKTEASLPAEADSPGSVLSFDTSSGVVGEVSVNSPASDAPVETAEPLAHPTIDEANGESTDATAPVAAMLPASPATDPLVSVAPADSAGNDPSAAMPSGKLPTMGSSPGSNATTKAEKAQAAPFDLDGRMQHVAALQERALKHDRFRTVIYCRSGLELIEVKKEFRALGRRDFCRCTKEHGIQPWFRKRAMRIARHFGSEEACKGIPLPEALRISKRYPAGSKPSHAPTSGPNGRLPRTCDGEMAAEDGGVLEDTWPTEIGAIPDDDEPDSGEETGPGSEPEPFVEEEIPPVTDAQIAAAEMFVSAAGGLKCAVRILVARSIRNGDLGEIKDALAEVLRAASGALDLGEISTILSKTSESLIYRHVRNKGLKVVSL